MTTFPPQTRSPGAMAPVEGVERTHDFGSADARTENASTVHVAFGVDEHFVRPMGVTMTSLLANNPEEHFVFHVFANSIQNADLERLEHLARDTRTAIHVYRVDKTAYGNLPTTAQFSHATYSRFLVADILRGRTRHALYLDADIVCMGRIRALLETDLGDAVAAVVADQNEIYGSEQRNKLGLPPGRYFNAGMMYLSVDKWLDSDVSARCLRALGEAGERFNLLDQDALNVVLDGHVRYVEKRWNFMCNLQAEAKSPRAVTQTVPNDAVFVHFIARAKPWHRWCVHPLAAIFHEYAGASLWRDCPLIERPPTYREMRLLSRALFSKHNFLRGSYWYVRYTLARSRAKRHGVATSVSR